MIFPIVDLHSDLLSYLRHEKGRSPDDPASRSSHPDLVSGRVIIQTLAIFTQTGPRSIDHAHLQLMHFCQLINSSRFASFDAHLTLTPSSCVHLVAAYENASGFALEQEPLEDVFSRLENNLKLLGRILYISLTWDGENRFGGGIGSPAGLKEDGKRLLEWMNGRRIAIDLSHASDTLAHEIIAHIDQHKLSIPLLASHSNFRSITPLPRNLPEDIAREIIRRKGLIGLNFFAPFIHESDPYVLCRHVEYGLKLGGEAALSFGADFFCDSDIDLQKKYGSSPFFFDMFANSSSYPRVLEMLQQELSLKEATLHNIAHRNALSFLDS